MPIRPENCDDANLRAMCNGCHLHYDRDHHRQTAAATRRSAREAAGQLALNFGEHVDNVNTSRPVAYWENRGPRDWQPVTVVTRYGPGRGVDEPALPLVRTGAAGPRNVAIRRADGTTRVLPVRTLRRERSC